jgi:hypothetical protein
MFLVLRIVKGRKAARLRCAWSGEVPGCLEEFLQRHVGETAVQLMLPTG